MEGREEMACVVQINLCNGKVKSLLTLVLLQDEHVDIIQTDLSVHETSDLNLLISALSKEDLGKWCIRKSCIRSDFSITEK